MLGRTDRRLRIVLLLIFFAVFALGAVARLGYWQVARGSELQQVALSQMERPMEEQAIRGNIYDRNGVVLATTAFRDTLAAYPDQVSEKLRQTVVSDLTPILQLDKAGVASLVSSLSGTGHYAVVDRELTEDQSAAVRAVVDKDGLKGLVLEPHAVRLYPNPGGAPATTLASQLIGFVTSDGAGTYGIEQHYDSILAGRPKLMAALRDAFGRPLQSTAQVLDPGADGQDVHLTIDASLQLQLEKELYAAWTADNAKSASAVILDPHTGELLAYASVPGYDANNYSATAASDPGVLQDPIVSQVYEPGSVMKMFTAAAALKAGVVTPTSTVKDQRELRFGTQVIHNSDHKSMGSMTFRDAIAYSRNLAVAGVAARLDKSVPKASAKLYDMWKTLGIGQQTGIDLSGEVSGIAPDPATSTWQPVDLANRAFGQSVAVTQIQLAVGYATMANGGYRVQPHLLQSIGTEPPTIPVAPTQVLTPMLAGQLKGIMSHVTASVSWYAAGSLIHGYQIGGKTGTAQLWDPAGGAYTYNKFNFSFVGFAGGDTPAAVIAVRIAEAVPRVHAQGQLELGITSYELFHRIAVDTLARLDVPRATDPNAGYPEPGSMAEQTLYPQRYDAWKATQKPPTKHHKPSHQTHHANHAAVPGTGGL